MRGEPFLPQTGKRCTVKNNAMKESYKILLILLVFVGCSKEDNSIDSRIDNWTDSFNNINYVKWTELPDSSFKVLDANDFTAAEKLLDSSKIILVNKTNMNNLSFLKEEDNYTHLVRAVYYGNYKKGYKIYTNNNDSLLILHYSLSTRNEKMKRTALLLKLKQTPKYVFVNAITDE